MAEKLSAAIVKSPKKNLEFMRKKDREPVRGIFRYFEVPGGRMKFPYKKYEGDKVERLDLVDGETYTIPLGVAKHLNSSGGYPIHAHAMDGAGKNIYKVGQIKRRYGFQSLEFIDPVDFDTVDSGIVTVEKV